MTRILKFSIAGFFLVLAVISQHRGFWAAMFIAFFVGLAFFVPSEWLSKKIPAKIVRPLLIGLAVLGLFAFIVEANVRA